MDTNLANLLTYSRFLYQLFQYAHWKTHGGNFYGAHLLFNRLYDDQSEELDQVAEKIAGIDGADDIDPQKSASNICDFFNKIDDVTNPEILLKSEKEFIEFIDDLIHKLEEDGKYTTGLQDFLPAISSKHEEHCYLLQQVLAKSTTAGALSLEGKMSLSKRAESEKWEKEKADKVNSKLITMFSEFIDHRKGGNRGAAKHMAEILIRLIPDHTSEMVKLFNMDSRAGVATEEETEKTIERLKTWKDILKGLNEFVEKGSSHTEKKQIGPIIRKKKDIEHEASILVDLYKLAHTLDKKGQFDMSDEIDKMIETLAQRVGLKDMITLANDLDQAGEVEAANIIDERVKGAKKK